MKENGGLEKLSIDVLAYGGTHIPCPICPFKLSDRASVLESLDFTGLCACLTEETPMSCRWVDRVGEKSLDINKIVTDTYLIVFIECS